MYTFYTPSKKYEVLFLLIPQIKFLNKLGFLGLYFFIHQIIEKKVLSCVLIVSEPCPIVSDVHLSRIRYVSEPYLVVSDACPSQKIIFFKWDT